MAMSNSTSTASIKFTIFRELTPKSLNWASDGKGLGTTAPVPKTDLTSEIRRSLTPSFPCGSTRFHSRRIQCAIIPVAQDTEYVPGFTYVFEMREASLSNDEIPVQLLSERASARIIA